MVTTGGGIGTAVVWGEGGGRWCSPSSSGPAATFTHTLLAAHENGHTTEDAPALELQRGGRNACDRGGEEFLLWRLFNTFPPAEIATGCVTSAQMRDTRANVLHECMHAYTHIRIAVPVIALPGLLSRLWLYQSHKQQGQQSGGAVTLVGKQTCVACEGLWVCRCGCVCTCVCVRVCVCAHRGVHIRTWCLCVAVCGGAGGEGGIKEVTKKGRAHLHATQTHVHSSTCTPIGTIAFRPPRMETKCTVVTACTNMAWRKSRFTPPRIDRTLTSRNTRHTGVEPGAGLGWHGWVQVGSCW